MALIAPRVPLCRMFALLPCGPHWTLEDLLQAPPQEDNLMRTRPQAEGSQQVQKTLAFKNPTELLTALG